MQVMRIERFGGPEVLQPATAPDPVPGPGEVAIEVGFASVTFVETQLRAGRPPHEAMRPRLPAVLGNGVVGTITGVGDGVDPSPVGHRVAAMLRGRGGYAERAVTAADRVVPVPPTLASADAAALLADGRTAMSLLDAVGDVAGRTVLVEAAAGGVGGLLVQLVLAAGGIVVAAAGSSSKLAAAAALGAAVTVDYRSASWVDQVRGQVGAVDVVLDGVGGEIGTAALGLVRPGGGFLAYGAAAGAGVHPGGAAAGRPDVRTVSVARPDVGRLVELTARAFAAAVGGRVRARIGLLRPLEAAADAHAAIEARAVIGKTLLATAR